MKSSRRNFLLGASSLLAMPAIARAQCVTAGMTNSVYFQNDVPGSMVAIAGRGGRQIYLKNPDTGLHEARCIQVAGGQPGGVRQFLFNNSAIVDGVGGQSLQANKGYYAGVFLPSGGDAPKFTFNHAGMANPAQRYSFDPDSGNAEWTDPAGNRAALVGMCYVVNDPDPTVSSRAYGWAPRLLCSPAPWLIANPQPLPITTAQAGGAIIGPALHEINPQYHRITSVAWAWRGVWSMFNGFIWADTANTLVSTIIKVRSLSNPAQNDLVSGYMEPPPNKCDVTCVTAGYRMPISVHAALALDDGVYEFSFWGSATGGNVSYNITHSLHGYF